MVNSLLAVQWKSVGRPSGEQKACCVLMGKVWPVAKLNLKKYLQCYIKQTYTNRGKNAA